MELLSTVFAQTNISIAPTQMQTQVNGFTIPSLIQWVITLILVVAGVVFFFMLIIGGIRWILSGGDKASTEAARGQITSALIGLVIVFSAWAIANFIHVIFPSVDLFNLTLGTLQ